MGAGAAGKKKKTKHQGSALSHRSGNIILTPFPSAQGKGSSSRPPRDRWKDGGGKDVWMEQTMSDVPATRQPVPRPRWNDYQVFQRAAVSHASSILHKKKNKKTTISQCQTAVQSLRQTDRQTDGGPLPINLDGT